MTNDYTTSSIRYEDILRLIQNMNREDLFSYSKSDFNFSRFNIKNEPALDITTGQILQPALKPSYTSTIIIK